MVQPAVSQMEEEWVDEASGEEAEGDDEARALQPWLLALVRAASGEPQEGRAGVWMEHSYARAKIGAGAVRVLLARPPSPSPTDIDVVTPQPEPMRVPGDSPPPEIVESDEGDAQPDFEARVLALAPTPLYYRLARSAIDALLDLRLARLAGGPSVTASVRRDEARHAARVLRCALAPYWAASGPHGGPVSWLVSTISAHAGKALGALWREMLCELRGAVPRLAARLVPAPPPPPPDPLDRIGPAVSGSGPGPWLVWVAVGPEEARWPRRLRALLHTHVVRADGGAPGAPEAWCSAAAAAARQALLDVIAEAGSRPVVVGGAGAGAALASALLAGSAGVGAGVVRALVLLAPPLLTAEGETTHLHRSELDLPLLVVVGSAGASCARGAALELLAGPGAGGCARRVVEVRGADDALRLPARLRRRLRVPQAALDAAVAEECVRWAMQAAEGEPPQRRTPKKGAGEVTEERRGLHAARGLLREAEPTTVAEQTRVVSRGSGGTPLTLLPPRRATPATPTPTPIIEEPELDIMQLPIVFADDECTPPVATPAPVVKRPEVNASPSVTVTSGHPRGGRALNYTRVIVAKRRGAATGRGAGGARPVLLRRTVRLVQKGRPH